MAKLVLSALLHKQREGVEAKSAEFPDIKVSALSVGVALAHLRGFVAKNALDEDRHELQ
jgi:hypothetical protein